MRTGVTHAKYSLIVCRSLYFHIITWHDVFFGIRLSKRLIKQWSRRWIQKPWRWCDFVMWRASSWIWYIQRSMHLIRPLLSRSGTGRFTHDRQGYVIGINTLRPIQNGRQFANDIFKRIFLNENIKISMKISLRFIPKCPIDNSPALVQIMAWRLPGDKPLSEPMMVSLLTHICVTRPQWLKAIIRLPLRQWTNPEQP